MKHIRSVTSFSPKRYSWLFMLALFIGANSPVARAICARSGGVTCCANVFKGPGGLCCSAYGCSDGSGGGSCSACNLAKSVDPKGGGTRHR
jgi:hypothetical protein